MKKPTKTSAAARELSLASRAKRLATLTPEQRSAQARKAVNSRRDRQKPGPWFGLLVFPEDYCWKGTAHAAKVIDELHANPNVVFWSQDRTEVIKRALEKDLRDRQIDIIEQTWNPNSFSIRREYKPDAERQLKALQAVLDNEGGRV